MYDFDVPIPKQTRKGRKKHAITEQLIGCPIGASFFVAERSPINIAPLIRTAKKEVGGDVEYKTMTVNVGGVEGVRVWRVA